MKQKTFYSWLLAGLVSVSAMTLAACGGNKESASVEPDPSQEESISSPEPTIDYGTLTIEDIELAFQGEVIITPVFSKEEYEEDLTYDFEGNNIEIVEGKIKGLVPGTETTVRAEGEHFTTTFKVKVGYLEGTLTNDTGAESKYAVTLPPASVKNYVINLTCEFEQIVEAYTRICSFAFNGSDNSWYNLEYSNGTIQLFGRFNGHEKYFILVGQKSDFMVGEKFQFDVHVVKQGQKTMFYVNDKIICGFDEEEMEGYAELSSFEVTAAADRENAGKYVVNLKKVYWELEGSDNYEKYSNPKLTFSDEVLAREDGSEAKVNYGDVSLVYGDFLYSTTVDVSQWDNELFRPIAVAFNGSDNSWYNIEMNNAGDLTLYGHFNGVEKYNIPLGNKSSLMQDDKIHFEVKLLKIGQSTYYFFNGELKCWFVSAEMRGYAKLSNLEVTACSDVWHDGAPYSVALTNTKIVGKEDESFKTLEASLYKSFENKTLTSDADGHEVKQGYGAVTDNCLFTMDVVVDQTPNDWFRPVAVAFNGTDWSWFNLETGTSGDLTLFAKMSGTEKYFIPLGNMSDYLEGGKTVLHIAILKQGQETFFFLNDVLKCSFTGNEVAEFGLNSIEATACADRSGGQFIVEFNNVKLSDPSSDLYKKYDGLKTAE